MPEHSGSETPPRSEFNQPFDETKYWILCRLNHVSVYETYNQCTKIDEIGIDPYMMGSLIIIVHGMNFIEVGIEAGS